MELPVQGLGDQSGSSVREGLGAVLEVSEVLSSVAVSGSVVLLSGAMMTCKEGSAAEGLDRGSDHGLISGT